MMDLNLTYILKVASYLKIFFQNRLWETRSLQLLKSADEFDITNMVSEPSRAFID